MDSLGQTRPSRVRVGGIAQAVAEEVEGEDHEDDGDDGEHEPGVERDDVDVLTAGSLDRQSGQK